MSDKPFPSAEEIERLQRRRTRLTLTQALLFLLWQTSFLLQEDSGVGDRAVDRVKIGAYVVWALLLLVFLMTGGNWWSPREVRAVLNDETTTSHRHRAMSAGFLVASAAAVGLYLS